MPATRLVQIKLPVKEHRALAIEAKQAGRTLTGHIRLALTERRLVAAKPETHKIMLRMLTLLTDYAETVFVPVESQGQAANILEELQELRGQLGNPPKAMS